MHPDKRVCIFINYLPLIIDDESFINNRISYIELDQIALTIIRIKSPLYAFVCSFYILKTLHVDFEGCECKAFTESRTWSSEDRSSGPGGRHDLED